MSAPTLPTRNRWEAFCNETATTAGTAPTDALYDKLREAFPLKYGQCAEDDALEFIRSRAAAYPRAYELVDIDVRDELSTEQAAAIVKGEPAWDITGSPTSTDDWISENQHDGASYYVTDTLKDLGYDDDALDALPDGDQDVRQALYDVDASNPWRDLARNTPGLLAEQILAWGEDLPTLSIYDDAAAHLEATAAVAAALAPLGLPLTTRWRAARELLIEQTSDYRLWEGMTLGILHVADVGAYFDTPTPAKLRHAGRNVSVGLIDHGNGSGHEVILALPAPVDLPTDTHPVRLESDLGTYGWDDIAGVHLGGYDEPALIPAPAA